VRFTSIICMLAAITVNLSANAFTMPSDINQLLSVVSWVFCSIAFVVVTYYGFAHIDDSKWLWALSPLILACSISLSYNAGDRIASGYQAASDRRSQLNEMISRAQAEIDDGCEYKPTYQCVVEDQRQIIRDASAELRTLPLVSSVSKANEILPLVIGIGPDLCNAMMAIVAGIRRRKPEIVEQIKKDKAKRKQQRRDNIYDFKKKVRSNSASMGKKLASGMKKLKPKFPTLGKSKKKLPKSGNNGQKSRRQRVCTDAEMGKLWKISQEYFAQNGKLPTAGELKNLSGMHAGKISNYRKRVKEGYTGNREAI